MTPAVSLAAFDGGISITQLLTVLALMLIMMVAGLMVLVQRRARDLREWPIVGPLADVVLSSDPKNSVLLLRYLVGAANSVAGVAALNYGVAEGVVSGVGCGWLTGCALGVAVLFYALMRSGLSQRFSDPSLALPQILCAEIFLAWGYVLGGPGGPVALLLLFVFLMFSMFTSTSRVLALASLAAAVFFGAAMVYVAHTQHRADYDMAKLQLVYFTVMVFMLASVSLMVVQLNRLRDRAIQRKRELADALARIQDLATRDDLTGLFNRRHMLEMLNTEKHRSIRTGRRFCIALIDVDHFKQVNDLHGHGVGDEVLGTIATVIADGLRETDVVARWGGEEFLLLFTDTDCPSAELVLLRIQMLLAATTASKTVPELQVTFSAGLTHFDVNEMLTRTIDRADRALYMAKAGGRNRVVRLEPQVSTPMPGQSADSHRATDQGEDAQRRGGSGPLEDGDALDVGGMGKHVHRPA